MTYLALINKLRVELKDSPRLQRDRWDGDATTKIFPLSSVSVKDASYVVKIDDVAQVEVTDYTIDKDTGIIEFTSAPAATSDDNVECTYLAVNIRDEDYLEIINDGIDYFRWKFWRMDTDEDTLTTVADQYEYDCSGITGILYILKAWYKTSSGSTFWQDIQGLTNYKYYTRLQKLYVDPTFASSSLSMKLLYLKSFTKGTTPSATLDIPDEWILPYKFYCYARYYERLIPERINETGAVTTFPSFAPSQVIFNIAENYYRKAEEVASKLAPKLPPMSIKQLHEGVAL